jgi:copper chaperone CopZ
MKTFAKLSAFSLVALCVAATSWAGGSSCTSGGAKSAEAKSADAGSHCTMKSNATMTSGEKCTVKANQVMYSYAVPTVECGKCVESIQKAAMALKGVACAHVDLKTHTAYIIADKTVDQRNISKVIATAGYKNKYEAQGSKVQAEFAKAIASGDNGVSCCAKAKDKV